MQLAWRAHPEDPAADSCEPSTLMDEPAGQDDLACVRRAQVDPAAFAPLYERYAPIVYHYCLRRLSNPEAAADATAVVFTRSIGALPRFRPDPKREGSTFRAWLFTIAHNVVIDIRRRHRNHVSLDSSASATLMESPHLIDPGASPEELAIGADEARRVRTMLQQLPERQQAIVELRLAGLSGAEISRSLGMSESAVKSAQFRAYHTLRELLHDHAPANATRESSR